MARSKLSRFLRPVRPLLRLEPMEDRVVPAITLDINPVPETAAEGTLISATATTDAGTPTYSWSVTKDGADFAAGTDASFSFTPDDDGTYVVTLTVTGADPADPATTGSATDTATIEVTNADPTVLTPASATLDEGSTFTGSGSVTDPGTADTFTATVNVPLVAYRCSSS